MDCRDQLGGDPLHTRTPSRLQCALAAPLSAQSYVFFLRRNSADLAKNILSEVNHAAGALMSTLALTAKTW